MTLESICRYQCGKHFCNANFSSSTNGFPDIVQKLQKLTVGRQINSLLSLGSKCAYTVFLNCLYGWLPNQKSAFPRPMYVYLEYLTMTIAHKNLWVR